MIFSKIAKADFSLEFHLLCEKKRQKNHYIAHAEVLHSSEKTSTQRQKSDHIAHAEVLHSSEGMAPYVGRWLRAWYLLTPGGVPFDHRGGYLLITEVGTFWPRAWCHLGQVVGTF